MNMTSSIASLFPKISSEELQLRLRSLSGALGARVFGLARRLVDPAVEDSEPCFEVLAVAGSGSRPQLSPERSFPLEAFYRLFVQGHGYRVEAGSEGPLGRWLSREGGGRLVGWALPGDRLACVACVAWVAEDWDPGPIRLRVAQQGMESLARILSPPAWLLHSQQRPADSVRPLARESWRTAEAAEHLQPSPGSLPSRELFLEQARDELEATLIRQALRLARGNKSDAARRLRLSRQSLYRKLRRYGLEPEAAGSRES